MSELQERVLKLYRCVDEEDLDGAYELMERIAAEHGKKALPVFAQMLAAEHFWLRKVGCAGLGRIGDRAAAKILEQHWRLEQRRCESGTSREKLQVESVAEDLFQALAACNTGQARRRLLESLEVVVRKGDADGSLLIDLVEQVVARGIIEAIPLIEEGTRVYSVESSERPYYQANENRFCRMALVLLRDGPQRVVELYRAGKLDTHEVGAAASLLDCSGECSVLTDLLMAARDRKWAGIDDLGQLIVNAQCACAKTQFRDVPPALVEVLESLLNRNDERIRTFATRALVDVGNKKTLKKMEAMRRPNADWYAGEVDAAIRKLRRRLTTSPAE